MFKTKDCFVPGCRNSSKKTPDLQFFPVPGDEKMRKDWFKSVKRYMSSFDTKKTFYCCQSHFNIEVDCENFLNYKLTGCDLILRSHTTPHLFGCWETTKPKKINHQSVSDSDSCADNNTSAGSTDKENDVESSCFSTEENNIPVLTQENNCCPMSEEIAVQGVDIQNSTNDIQHSTYIMNLENVINHVASPSYTLSEDILLKLEKKKRKRNFTPAPINWRVPIMITEPIVIEDGNSTIMEDTILEQDDTVEIMKETFIEQQNLDGNSVVAIEESSYLEGDSNDLFGIEQEYLHIIDNIKNRLNIDRNYILACLVKLRNDVSTEVLANAYGKTKHFDYVINYTAKEMAKIFQLYLTWPGESIKDVYLSATCKAKRKEGGTFLTCFELDVDKPPNPKHYSITWSEKYQRHTIKFLLSCNESGWINFVSKGYGGYVKDYEVALVSGYLDAIKNGLTVSCRHTFRHREIRTKLGEKACLLKIIDESENLSVIENVIDRIRSFTSLCFKSPIENTKPPKLLDNFVIICCGILNMQLKD